MNGNTTIQLSRLACARRGSPTPGRPLSIVPSASSTDRLNVSTKTLKEPATARLTQSRPGRPPSSRSPQPRQRIKVESNRRLHRTPAGSSPPGWEKAVDNPTTPAKDLDASSRAFPEHGEGVSLGSSSTRMAWTYRRLSICEYYITTKEQDGSPRLHSEALKFIASEGPRSV